MKLEGKKYSEFIIKVPNDKLEEWEKEIDKINLPFYERKIYQTYLKELKSGF